jgi:pullulanase/glycogen debranching enzyme
VQLLARLRRLHVEFRRETFLKGAASRASVKDVTWLNVGGTEMKQGEWQDGNLRALGIWFGKRNDLQRRLLLLLNAGDIEQKFTLPAAPADEPWIRQFDTALDTYQATSLGHARDYRLDASSAALLEC